MTLLVRARARFSQDPVHARALHAWRAAERRVREPWDLYRAALLALDPAA